MYSFENYAKCMFKLFLSVIQSQLHITSYFYESNRKNYEDCIRCLEQMKVISDSYSHTPYYRDFNNSYILCKRLINELDFLYKLYEERLPNAREYYDTVTKCNFIPHMYGVQQLINLFYSYKNNKPLKLLLIEHKTISNLQVMIDYIVNNKEKDEIVTVYMQKGKDSYVLIPQYDYMDRVAIKLHYSYCNDEVNDEFLEFFDLHDGINVYGVSLKELNSAKPCIVPITSSIVDNDVLKAFREMLGYNEDPEFLNE